MRRLFKKVLHLGVWIFPNGNVGKEDAEGVFLHVDLTLYGHGIGLSFEEGRRSG